jgi:hypothetical protein
MPANPNITIARNDDRQVVPAASLDEIIDALERLVAARASGETPAADLSVSAHGAPRHSGRLLGTLLVIRGFLVRSELDAALARQQATGQRLGQVVVQMGFISEGDLIELLAEQLRMSRIDLDRVRLDRSLAGSLTRAEAHRLGAVPVQRNGDSIEVAVADPTDAQAIQALGDTLGAPLTLFLASRTDVDAAIDRLFG